MIYLLKVLVEHSVYKVSDSFLYYSISEIKKGTRVKIIFNNKELIGFVISCEKSEEQIKDLEEKFGFNIKSIDSIIDEEPLLNEELFALATKLSERYFYPIIGIYQAMLPSKLKPRTSKNIDINIKYKDLCYPNKLDDSLKLSLSEKNVYKLVSDNPGIFKSQISNKSALKKLIEKKIVEVKKMEEYRYQLNKIYQYESEIILTKEQEKVYQDIKNTSYLTYLLYGITGSGKTEIYIRLIEDALKENKTCLILVPEISLTALMISRILSYFPDTQIAVIHSSLTPTQSYDEYRKIKDGLSKIVIGTRSSVFAPLKNLGLIFIDEEHDESYKQVDGFPYSAKDVAILRAQMNGAKVILGSGTPSIESMSKAKRDIYHLEKLDERYNKNNSIKNYLIDNSDHSNYSLISNVFSLPLIKGIKDTISRNEQCLLLINAKGYARYIYCRECGHIFKCPSCDLPLVYHKSDKKLHCHVCEKKMPFPKECPICGSKYIATQGIGIEKVEEDFKKIFNVPYFVIDKDRFPSDKKVTSILKDFDDQKAPVLIGTQMISKGHDFKNVTLVGIINADLSMSFFTYRSREITYQLIAQTIGRNARRDKDGVAFVQTSLVNDYAIIDALNDDYEDFYNREIKQRKMFSYPPFFNIVSLILTSKKEDELLDNASRIKEFLILNNNITVLGPSGNRKKGLEYVTSLTIKVKNLQDIAPTLNQLIDIYKNENKFKNIKIKIDVNPYIFD